MIYVSQICHKPHTCGLDTTKWTHPMGNFNFYTSIVHKFTPSNTSDLASDIFLCNSERKYNTSESEAI